MRNTAAAGASQEAAAASTVWFDRPMRWAQLTLVENDPGRFDPAFWLEYFKHIHADAACLSAGGVVAYYPTGVRLHHRSNWLASTDPFGDLLRGCRDLGMVVIARTDPHAAHQNVFNAHPDWIAVDADFLSFLVGFVGFVVPEVQCLKVSEISRSPRSGTSDPPDCSLRRRYVPTAKESAER